jgi:replicative DNA helicase
MTPGRIEHVILSELLNNADYTRRFHPHLKPDFFLDRSEKCIFTCIEAHVEKYGVPPTFEQLAMAMNAEWKGDQDELDECLELASSFARDSSGLRPMDWLKSETERFIQRQGFHVEILNLITDADKGKNPLPALERAAQAYEYKIDDAQGHDLFRDWPTLHQHMTDSNERFPFDVPELNRLTNGGITRKTLNILLAPTNVGKSLVLCHLAASYVRQGRNVLYVTLEMSDMTTAQRITANMLDIEMGRLRRMQSEEFGERMAGLRQRYNGNLAIREYPASSTNVKHFRALLKDLKRKQKFVPDVLIVDYLNLCGAASLGKSAKGDLYQTVGTIAAELRGFATEQNVVVWTATQTNRNGYKGAEIELEHTSESYSVNSTADLIFGLSRDEKVPDKMLVKLLKQRNEGIAGSRKTVVMVDSARMKIFELDQAEQVKEAITSMPPKKAHSVAARVAARSPRFALVEKT